MSSVAQATWRWDGRLELSFPYSKYLVEDLKADIPVSNREWNPDRKVWNVHPAYAIAALRLMREVFGEVIVEDRNSPRRDPLPPADRLQIDPDFARLHILPTAPRCVIDAAYRALSKQCHPDRVPEGERVRAHEEMIAISNAYDAVKMRVAS